MSERCVICGKAQHEPIELWGFEARACPAVPAGWLVDLDRIGRIVAPDVVAVSLPISGYHRIGYVGEVRPQ